ncbi:MAG: undecaprenyl-diphosphate phosphatase [Lachnospiraceae bacterium]|nr:undecaprenyl-diphosphate phosphatase [Lachnospiraceae bacterium]
MSLLEALFLAVVQGVAEFLPISSSGHLAIFKNVFGVNTDTGLLYDVMLHVGTLAAVFIVYWKDIWELIREGFAIIGAALSNTFKFITNLFSKEKKEYTQVINTPYRRFVMLVIISTIPTGILGIVLSDVIENASTTLLVPGICLLITSLLLYISEKVPEKDFNESNTSYGKGLIIGIVQGFATLPGISRSGSTITAGLFCGLERSFAVKYSFILSIPAILGAAVLELKDFNEISVGSVELVNYIVGMVVAAVVGYICIRWLLVLVKNKKFKYFSIYCFAVGIIAIVAHFVI